MRVSWQADGLCPPAVGPEVFGQNVDIMGRSALYHRKYTCHKLQNYFSSNSDAFPAPYPHELISHSRKPHQNETTQPSGMACAPPQSGDRLAINPKNPLWSCVGDMIAVGNFLKCANATYDNDKCYRNA